MGQLKNRIPELFLMKSIRDKKRYYQKEMAQETGLAESAISRLMNYDTIDNIPLGHALIVARWLEVNIEDLVEEVEE